MKLIEELEAYADPNHPVSRLKDPRLVQAVAEVLNEFAGSRIFEPSSYELAELIYKVLERFKMKGGTPRFLLLIDELGWGLVNRLRRYIDERKEELYSEVDAVLNFLSYVYEKLAPLHLNTLLFMLAKADTKAVKREISAYVTDYSKVKIALKGHDLKDLGIAQGPVYQQIFHDLLMLHLDGKIVSKKDEISWILKHVEQGKIVQNG